MRRTLGFKLSAQARILMGFVDYCEQHDLDSITTQAAVAWAMDTPWAFRTAVLGRLPLFPLGGEPQPQR